MSLITAAAHNNAAWCDAVCRALGCDAVWADGLWVNRSPSPPYYPNAVSLHPSDITAQLARVRSMLDSALPRPWSVKDSFHQLDLAPLGFELLFEASWIGMGPDEPIPDSAGTDAAWAPVTTDADLLAWELAWRTPNMDAVALGSARLFQPALLGDPEIRFLAGLVDGRIVAAAIANRSDDGDGPVVGISNVVLTGDHPESFRSAVVSAVRTAFPGLPIVGYEWGDDLHAMLTLGFRSLGPLRVWTTSR